MFAYKIKVFLKSVVSKLTCRFYENLLSKLSKKNGISCFLRKKHKKRTIYRVENLNHIPVIEP